MGQTRPADGEQSAGEITEMLRAWSSGSREDAERLFPAVYDELKRQAQSFMRRERPGHTLQTTALIHEAYLKLREQRDFPWESRDHFFAICATLMRRILVDHARATRREKRGGGAERITLGGLAMAAAAKDGEVDVLALDEALERLGKFDPQQARIVELKFFSGLSIGEIAELLDISESTVKREWRAAKAWLRGELVNEEE